MHCQSLDRYGAALAPRESRTPLPVGGEVLIKVRHCGVCHSDLHLADGYFDLGGGKHLDIREGRTLPFILGHEIEGTVAAAGPQAQDVTPGHAYAVYPWIGCGTCAACRSGNEPCCDTPRQIGINVDGGYSSHVLVPDSRYLLDIHGIDPPLAGALMCSGLTAFSALKKLAVQAQNGPILIVGLGGVGLMALEFAKTLFHRAPLVADIDAGKRRMALKRGAAVAYDPADPGARQAIMSETGGVPGAVDFAGSQGSFVFANAALRKGGRLVVAGLLGGSFQMPIPMLPLRAVTIGGSLAGSLEDARMMMDLVRSGVVEAPPIERRPLAEANQALADLKAGRVQGRIVLTP
ncbi:MAG: alcohol dehydrogenase catalytic domain-containing protein [Rhodobiaceae bacterium]|nr:alcohol dehydrogenase catalytic domain-containing protein [Rhodobiaceae bacterium]